MSERKRPKPIIGNRRPNQERPKPIHNRPSKPINRRPIDYNPPKEQGNVNKKYKNSNFLKNKENNSNKPVNSINENRSSQSTTAVVTRLTEKPWVKFLLSVVIIFLLLFLIVFIYARFSNLNPDLSGNIGLYNISSNAAAVASRNRIVNVAVFGIDGREDVEGERSDTIMIGTADFKHNKLKITSLMRDTYTEMADEDYFDKLNAAYSLGGPEESLKTINLNFDTAITDYIVVDFTALVAVVNAVGGVDIEITSEDELYWLNQYLMDVNDKVKTADPDVPATGLQHLTGSQALAYARIRYVGNGDFERTQRQRNVLLQIVSKVSAMNPIEQINVIKSVLPYIQTSLRMSEMIKLGLNFILMSNRELEQSRLPVDEYAATGYLNGVSYVFPNTLVDNIKSWYQFIYEIDYTPSETAQEISNKIEETWY